MVLELNEHGNVINRFYDVDSALYMVTTVHLKGSSLLKVINVFHSVNLTLFLKRTRNSQKPGNNIRWKMTEHSNIERSKEVYFKQLI